MAPRDLHDNIKLDKVIASVKHTNIAFPAANVNELGTPISKNTSGQNLLYSRNEVTLLLHPPFQIQQQSQ